MHTSCAAGPAVVAFAHRQRRCDDMLAAVFRKLLSGKCTTRHDHGTWALACVRQGILGLLHGVWLCSTSPFKCSVISWS